MRNLYLVSMFTFGVTMLAIASCGGGRFGGPRGTIPKALVESLMEQPDRMQMAFFAEVPYVSIDEGLRGAIKKAFIRMAMSPLYDCTPSASGTKQDKDRDYVPADVTYSMNCRGGDEYMEGTFHMSDQNDSIPAMAAGMKFDIESGKGRLTLQGRSGKVEFSTQDGHLDYSVNGDSAEATATGEATITAEGSSTVLGFEGSAQYKGVMGNRQEGDTATLSGIVRYAGTKVAEVVDADFVARVEANVTMGKCGSSREVLVKSGTATLEDGEGNIVKIVAENCEGVVTYNGAPINFMRGPKVPMPE